MFAGIARKPFWEVDSRTMTPDERTAEMCRLVHLIVSSIADDVASIDTRPVLTADHRTFIQVQVNERDRGKLIGRDGRIAEALRQYVSAYQSQHGGAYGLAFEAGDTGDTVGARR